MYGRHSLHQGSVPNGKFPTPAVCCRAGNHHSAAGLASGHPRSSARFGAGGATREINGAIDVISDAHARHEWSLTWYPWRPFSPSVMPREARLEPSVTSAGATHVIGDATRDTNRAFAWHQWMSFMSRAMPPEVRLEPREASLEPFMAAAMPREARLEPREAPLEPFMAAAIPREA